MYQLKKLLFFANMDNSSFSRIQDEIRQSNRLNLQTFSGIASIALLLMFISSFFVESLSMNRTAYLAAMLVCLVLLGLAHAGRRIPQLVYVGVYCFLGLLFAFGIVLGTVTQPFELTVSFIVLLFVVPLLFTDIPIRMITAILIGIFVYLPAAYVTQTAEMFGKNLTDIFMYGALSIIVSSYMMCIKVRRIHLEKENEFLSQYDALTALRNRRSFEDDLNRIRSGQQAASLICSFDVNGLKRINDSCGHAAGDEMLQGAASCIQKVFGPYGSCYRIGGDEFIAILSGKLPDTKVLTQAFQKETNAWSGKLTDCLSVSLGMVPINSSSDLNEIVSQADAKMYASKAAHYQTHGIQ